MRKYNYKQKDIKVFIREYLILKESKFFLKKN